MGEGMKDDGALLTEYAKNGSEDAFREVVSRHAGLVYSAALRQVGQGGLAEEVMQAVFCILAKKAGKLGNRPVVAGWLHQTTRFAALKMVRSEQRRQQREQEASLMNDGNDDSAAVWAQISPHLDAGLASLGEADREALILRYFDERNLREVGALLGVSEDAAQKRVSRALEKLRVYFTRQKVGFSAGMLAAAIPANAVGAAPAALVGQVSTAALASGTAASVATLSLINETMNAIAWTKFKTALPIAALGIIAAGTPIAVQNHTIGDLRRENSELRMMLEAKTQEATKAVASKPAITAEEVAKLREDAADVHRLRAEIAKVKQASQASQAEIARMQSREGKLRSQLTTANERQSAAEDKAARQEEQQMLRAKQNLRKTLGLALHQVMAQGVPPKSFEEFAKNAGLSPQQLAEIRANSIFFPHENMEVNTGDGGHKILVADREPTRTIDGEQLWFFTMMDGSVITSRQPASPDGIFRPQPGEPRTLKQGFTIRQK